MSFDFISNVIYENDNIRLTEVNYPNMNFLDYIEYEDRRICFSKEKLVLSINYNINIDDKEGMIESIIDLARILKKDFDKKKKENDILGATIFCEKRDLVKMFYKMIVNNDFDYKELYEFAKSSYRSLECSYGYDLLANGMEICISKDNSIKTDILNSLKDKTNNDGKIIVYRGINEKNRGNDGISYTLDLETAKRFSKRWNSNGQVNKYEIDINDIIAYIDTGEKEIISKKAKLI